MGSPQESYRTLPVPIITLMVVALMALIQAVDLITFIPATLIWGIYGETNVFMGWAYENGGLFAVMALKIVGVSYTVAVTAWLYYRDSRIAPLAMALTAIIGALGAITNIMAIGLSV
jgi:hypothetical protein